MSAPAGVRGQTSYLSDTFEDGDISGWTEGQSGDWAASSSSPLTGSYSLKHNVSGSAGESAITYALSGLTLSSGITTWRINLKNGSWDPSGSNRFWTVLAANESDLGGITVDGYAVGVNLTGTDDILTLWKMTDGAADGAVVTSSLDWGSGDFVGIEVTRSAAGEWELKSDSDGGFDNLTSAGTATNSDYTATDYFGLFFDFTKSRAGELRMDDVSISQTTTSSTTSVQFSSASVSVAENVGTTDLTLSISNEDASTATTVEVALTGGTAANGSDIASYSTQTITFPAGSSANQTVTVTVTDDSSVEGDETAIFKLQNITGGNSAEVGSTSQFTLTIQDNEVIINEIHADPDATSGDANGDGTVSSADDEFIELINNSGAELSLSDWTISDGVGAKHTFASGRLLAKGQAAIVFGGGTPTGTFGGSITAVASTGGLGLNNSGDDVTVKTSESVVAATYTYGSEGDDNQSITRDPDLTGSFVKHSAATDAGSALFSPGTKIGGGAFAGIVTVTETGGSTAVTEGGKSDSITVLLGTPPSADVTISVSGDAQLTVSPSSLTFTSSNYSAAQTVTVTATDDASAEATTTATVTFSASSSDTNYDSFTISSVPVTVTDNDSPGVTVTETDGATAVTEEGDTDSYSVVLATQPSAEVTITATASSADVSLSSTTLTFTASNYATAQTVTVTAADDSDYEGTETVTVSHSAASDDGNYNGISIASVTATVSDNDVPSIVINEIHYNPSGDYSDEGYEFIEFHNSGSAAVDLSGFAVTSGISHTFSSGTTVAAAGYLVLARDSSSYSDAVQWSSGALVNTGEKVELSTASSGGLVVDSVFYGSTTPWPTSADGGGSSLELIHPALENNRGASWKGSATANGTPGAVNSVYDSSDPKPIIYSVSRTPAVPAVGENIAVTAMVSDNSGIASATIVYSVNSGAALESEMTTSGTTASGTVPSGSLLSGDRVRFFVKVTDDSSQTATSDTMGLFVGISDMSSLRKKGEDGVPLYEGYYCRVQGVATVGSGVYSASDLLALLQDSTAAVTVFKQGASSASIVQGRSYMAVGKLTHYKGNLEIIPDDATSDITDGGEGVVPEPQVVTISGLETAGYESFEGELVTVEKLSKTGESGSWPSAGNDGSLTVSDGTGALTLFIDADTDLDDGAEPEQPMNITGIIGQSDATAPYTSGYRLMPRAFTDIVAGVRSTVVQFGDSTATVTEGVDSAFVLSVAITDPHSEATGLSVSLVSGDSSDLGRFARASIVFPADSASPQRVTLSITNDETPEGRETFLLALTGVTGGNDAAVGARDTFQLTIVDDDLFPLTISEIHFNPATSQGNDSDFEFLELFNLGDTPAAIGGYAFRDGISHTFSDTDSVPARGLFLLASSADSYAGSRQWKSGGLKNEGEPITLLNAAGRLVDSLHYSPAEPWPEAGSGGGPSIELIHPILDNSLGENWTASRTSGGTPGTVTLINAPPATAGESYTLLEDDTLTVSPPGLLANDSDWDGSRLTAHRAASPEQGDLLIDSTGGFVYFPEKDFFGADTFFYRAWDGEDSSDAELVALHVTDVNDPPTAFDLRWPPDSFHVEISEATLHYELLFSWATSVDIDDPVHYRLVGFDSLAFLSRDSLAYPILILPYRELVTHLDSIGVVSGTWTVEAFDEAEAVSALNGPFRLTFDQRRLALEGVAAIPDRYALHPNYPNPFNPSTTIRYDLPEESHVSLTVYDLMGKQITSLVSESQAAGVRTVTWDGTDASGKNVSAGVYLYRIQAGEFSQTRKMVLLK